MRALSRSMRYTRAVATVDAHPVPWRSVNSDAARVSGKALKNWPWGSGEWGAVSSSRGSRGSRRGSRGSSRVRVVARH